MQPQFLLRSISSPISKKTMMLLHTQKLQRLIFGGDKSLPHIK